MTTTVQLFKLFYKAGLLEHNRGCPTDDMLEAMVQIDDLRESASPETYMECIHTDEHQEPIAHVSGMPCYNDNIWVMQQHCSVVPGHGTSIMLDLMHQVINNPNIEYVVGFYKLHNKRAARIWDLAFDLMGNESICSRLKYHIDVNYVMRPTGTDPLFTEAFGTPCHTVKKHVGFFTRPTGKQPEAGQYCRAILFKVCAESKRKFRYLTSA